MIVLKFLKILHFLIFQIKINFKNLRPKMQKINNIVISISKFNFMSSKYNCNIVINNNILLRWSDQSHILVRFVISFCNINRTQMSPVTLGSLHFTN